MHPSIKTNPTIGIDLVIFRSYQGTEVFSENLIFSLIEQNPETNFVIFKGAEFLQTFDHKFISKKNVKIVNLKRFRNSLGVILQQQLLLPFLSVKYGVDILYSTSPFFSYFAPVKKINTIHDCAYARYKEFRNLFSQLYITLSIKLSKKLSTVITVSDFSKKELIDMYDFKENRIHVIYEGTPDFDLSKDKSSENPLLAEILKEKYFVFVGITRPRKNIIRLVEAFGLFLKKNPGYKLVLAGSISTTFVDVSARISELRLNNEVIQTGFISNSDKVALYKHAQALLYPSLYEGFGLPVLEAQSLGVPVLTSNSSSLPEVAGDAAVFVDPNNVDEIAKGIESIALDSNLRSKLVENGYANLKRFSWSISADRLMQVIKRI